jgi:exopolysaccharide production protein ExoQ
VKSFLEKIYFVLVFGELTTAIARVLGGSSSGETGGRHESNPVLLAMNGLVLCATFYFVFPQLPRLWRALLQLRWIFLLYLWAVLSVAWSVDLATSIRMAAYGVIYLFSAAYFALRYEIDEYLDLLGRCFFGVAVLSVAGEYLLPPTDDLAPGWSGIFLQKNGLGMCMMLAIAVMIVQHRRWNLRRTAMLLFYVAMLALSQSFTAVISVAAVVLFVSSKRMAAWMRTVFWLTLALAACLSLVIGDPLELLLSSGGKSSSLTGRDVIWAFALSATAEKPWIGHGYGGAFWTESYGSAVQSLHWNPHHAHNGYLEILLDLGLIGLVLTVAVLINAWRRARRMRRHDSTATSLWVEVLVLAAVTHNLTESDFMASNFFWFLIVAASFASLHMENQARASSLAHSRVAEDETALLTA